MGIIFVDGFDHQNTSADLATGDDWTSAANVVISAASGRFGGKGLTQSGFNTNNLLKTFSSTRTQGILGFAINLPSLGGGLAGEWKILDSGGAVQLSLAIDSGANGLIQVYRGDAGGGGTLLGSTSSSLLANIWGYVEFQWSISTAAGTVKVVLNGNTVLNLTAQNTNPSGTTNWQSIQWANRTSGIFMDDLYMIDPATGGANAPLGVANGVQVETLFPTANQGSQQFTPLANTNWQEVSETAMDSNTSYNSSANLGNQDLFDIGALSDNPDKIFAVAVRSACERDSTTNPIKIKNRLVSSATESDGATITQGTSYAYQTDIYETDPATSAAWTQTGVDAAQIGYNLAGVS